MDDDNRLGEFLRARRQQVQPADVGLPGTATAGRRRVQGLRREELAMLAGVSADYYIRLEQGRDRHPSDAVIDSMRPCSSETKWIMSPFAAAIPRSVTASRVPSERTMAFVPSAASMT